MMREQLIVALPLCALLALLTIETAAWTAPPTVTVFDVGQGDAVLLSDGGYQVLIDGGPDGTVLSHLGHAMPFFDRTIDLLVLSHPDLDHVQSFPELLRRYQIGTVLFTGVDKHSPRYEEFLTLLATEGARIVVADPDEDIVVGRIHIDVLWPPPQYFGVLKKDANNTSIVLRARGPGGPSVLLTGDMEENEEDEILRAGVDVRADILKVPHHGSRTSSSTGFLLAVNPSLAIVSVAKENSYGLPNEDVMARYAAFGIPLRLTMEEGTIVVPLH